MPVEKKLVFAGIQNAGKTSILTTLDREFARLQTITPTKGVEFSRFEVLGTVLTRWDLGGQMNYRQRYLQDVEHYLSDTGLLIYVVDVQESDPTLQADALGYLRVLLDAFTELGQFPVLAVFVHKYDPDVQADPTIQTRVKTYVEAIQELRKRWKSEVWYYPTSIKEPVGLVRNFSHALMQVLDPRELIREELLSAAGKTGATIVYLVEKSGYVLGTSDPEGVPDDLRFAVERVLYQEVPSWQDGSGPISHELAGQDEVLHLFPMRLKADQFFLATAWSPENAPDLESEAESLREFEESLGRVLALLYP